MKRLLLLLLLLSATPVMAQTPSGLGGDLRLQTIPYDANKVIPLKVATRFQLTVIFGPDERVENVAIGDSDAWQVTLNGRGDALFIKPTRVNGPTNMTVITDARVYSFELSPTYSPAVDSPFTVRFLYPEVEASTPLEPVVQPEPGRYRLSGSRALRPSAITDDGVRTAIAWGPRQTLPAVFAINDRGEESLVDGYMRDGRYVIDAVHPALLFRLDRQTARAERLRPRTRR